MTDWNLYIWIGLTLLFVLVEAATAQLVTVWFAVGSVVSLLLCAFGVKNIVVQIVVFLLVSLIALIATRPLVKNLVNRKKQPTNADRAIGQTAVVTQTIDNLQAQGAVNLKGNYWTARSADDHTVIREGSEVTVKAIEGVKVIVEPKY